MSSLLERSGLSTELREPEDDAFLRRGLSDAYAGCDDAELLADFRGTGRRPAFFFSMREPAGTCALLRSRWPAAEMGALESAERIRAGEFDLLGRSRLALGSPPDWHFEPLSGKRTPRTHWARINHLAAEEAGEYKLLWELSRHQYFLTLGKAYWYSGDEKYAETLVDHLVSWMDSNPPKRGINWSSSLELSFRVMSWTWALYFLRHSPSLTPTLYLRVLKFFSLHGRHIETYLSTYFSPNTHLTGEALGLFYLGTLFPELERASQWQRKGLQILGEQAKNQVREDGVYFEQSTYYHRYTTDFYLHLAILAGANGIRLGEFIEAKLLALLDHLMAVQQPDGTTPLFGDDDGGRLAQLDVRAPNDFRDSLAAGAALFSRPDYKYAAGEASEGVLWLFGPEGLERYDALPCAVPDQASVAFREGGFFVMRDRWARDGSYLMIDCGPHGMLNCGHAHADVLSLVLAVEGQTFLVDPGTYTYTFPRTLRDELRRSRVHNTVTVDGQSSSVPGGPFQWKHIARSSFERWISRERFDYFVGAHDGYERLPDPVRHRRTVFFVKGSFWVIHDRVSAVDEHEVELSFQLAPELELVTEANRATALARGGGNDGSRLHLVAFGEHLELRSEDGRVSRSFGEMVRAPRCVISTRGRGVQEVAVLLAPGALPRAHSIPTSGGIGLCIQGGQDTDFVLIGDGGDVAIDGLKSDFEWTWMRRSADGTIREMVLINGRRLALDGREVIASEAPVSYLFARFSEDGVVVDSDAPDGLLLAPTGAPRMCFDRAKDASPRSVSSNLS